MNSNISSAGETTPPLRENEHPLSHSSASAAALEGTPVSEVQPEGRTHFHPTQDGWEQRKRDATGAFIGDWQETRELELFKDERTYVGEVGESEPDELQRDALAVFGKAYNRADDIARKKSLYERELKSLEPSSDRAQFLRRLLPLFDQAIAYQNDIMDRLQSRDEESEGLRSKNEAERAAAERQAILRDSIRLENILKINNRPNQVERLIEQIEKEEAERLDAQNRLAQVEARLTIPGQSAETLSSLNEAAANFRSAIAAYPEFIEARLDSARLIQAPYKKTEEIDPTIQDQIETLKKDILKQESLAQLFYRLGKNCVTRSIFDPQAYISRYINAENNYLAMARSEAERDQPRQTVIDLFLRAADFEKRATDELKENQLMADVRRSICLNDAGNYLSRAAEEAQKDEPRQTVIDLFLRAADFKERAAAALEKQNDPDRDDFKKRAATTLEKQNDPNRGDRRRYLQRVGFYLFAAGEEAQKDQPRQAVIDYFLRGAGFNERAVAALDDPNDPNRVARAHYLDSVGTTFSVVAQETQKDQPLKRVIDYFLSAVDFDERAIAALDKPNDPNRALRAKYLNRAGVYLFRAAIEARKAAPDNTEVEKLLQEALEQQSKARRLSLQAIEPGTTGDSCTIN